MNRQTRSVSYYQLKASASSQRSQPLPSNYRPAQPSSAGAPAPLYYAAAGGQATQQQQPGSRSGGPAGAGSTGGGVFPGGILSRGAPPGFGSRSTDPSDFPALGSHQVSSSTSSYPSQGQPNPQSSTLSQQLFMQGQQPINGLPPPPPPGIPGPTNQSQAQVHQVNGLGGDGIREEFPALGGMDGKDRMAAFLRNPNLNQAPPSPPSTLPNGASASQSTSATPSTNPPHPQPGTGAPSTTDSWTRQSPSRASEPLVRPVQQVMSSPVDKWGLQALLYEIKTSMGMNDRGKLLFGENLSELGVDLNAEESIYPTFVTPWLDPSQITHSMPMDDNFHIPQCYHVQAPALSTKLPNFSEDTLFYVFYSAPQDVVQLEVAEELYNRGWRYNMSLQLWMSSPALQALDPREAQQQDAPWIRGPIMIFDSRTWQRTPTGEGFMVNPADIEATRPAAVIVSEEQARKEAAVRSPNGSGAMPGGAGGAGRGPNPLLSQYVAQGQGISAS